MESRISYIVEYAKKNSIYESYGDFIKEYWSVKTLSNRLKSNNYHIHSAVMAIVNAPDIVVVDDD